VLVHFDHVASFIVNADQQFSDGVISSVISSVISLPDYAPQTLRIRNFYLKIIKGSTYENSQHNRRSPATDS
jgi:hypothetical protein